MTALGLNALGYQEVREPPDTRPSSERAADLLKQSVTRNINDRDARELEALQGIGFALLAIAERPAAVTREPSPPGPPARRWRFRKAVQETS